MTDEAKRIYELRLHHAFTLDCGTQVRRVVGGWIYVFFDERGNTESTTFVPYSDEFAPDSKRVTDKLKEVYLYDTNVVDIPQPR